MTLGNRIQQLRKEHNMSQGDLADALDISRQSVSKWETDTATPDLDKLLKLSEKIEHVHDELIERYFLDLDNYFNEGYQI